MTRIHLIRHGQTNWNLERRIQGRTDSMLTDLGHQQAKEAGLLLKDIPFHAAYSSSSIRAKDTAQHILKYHSIDLLLRDDLREIFLAHWEGNLYDDMGKADPTSHGHFWQDPSQFRIIDGETFQDVQDRAIEAIQDITKQHNNSEVLLVSHGVWIKALLSFVENRHLRDFWAPPKMTNCCHSIIKHDGSNSFLAENFSIEQYGNMTQW